MIKCKLIVLGMSYFILQLKSPQAVLSPSILCLYLLLLIRPVAPLSNCSSRSLFARDHALPRVVFWLQVSFSFSLQCSGGWFPVIDICRKHLTLSPEGVFLRLRAGILFDWRDQIVMLFVSHRTQFSLRLVHVKTLHFRAETLANFCWEKKKGWRGKYNASGGVRENAALYYFLFGAVIVSCFTAALLHRFIRSTELLMLYMITRK